MNGWLIATRTMIVVGRIPQIFSWKKGKRYPETRVICGIARKTSAAINIQNAYRYGERERAYPPRVPRNKEIVTTKKVTITEFLAAYQNSPSIQASLNAFKV